MAYVYLHTRLDTNEIFYVGISSKDDDFKRSRSKKQRNLHWKNIVNKTDYSVDVVHRNISWEKACELEIKLIKFYGRFDLGLGGLVNMTDGGEGRNNIIVSEETKNKLSEAQIGKKHSEVTKKKLADINKGEGNSFFGKTHSDESKKKMSESSKGKKLSEETKAKMKGRQNRLGKFHSDETKKKQSQARKGKSPSNKGKKMTEEQKAQLKLTRLKNKENKLKK